MSLNLKKNLSIRSKGDHLSLSNKRNGIPSISLSERRKRGAALSNQKNDVVEKKSFDE